MSSNKQDARGMLSPGSRAESSRPVALPAGAVRPMRFSWLRGGTLLAVLAILIGEAVFLTWVVQNPAVTPADEAMTTTQEPVPRPAQPARLEFRVGDAARPASRSDAVWSGLLGISNRTAAAAATNLPPVATGSNAPAAVAPIVALTSNLPAAATTVVTPTAVLAAVTSKVESVVHHPPPVTKPAASNAPAPVVRMTAAVQTSTVTTPPPPVVHHPATVISNAVPPHVSDPSILTIAPSPSNPPPAAIPVPGVFGNGRLLRLRPAEDADPRPLPPL